MEQVSFTFTPSAVSCLYCEHDQVHEILHGFTPFLDDGVDQGRDAVVRAVSHQRGEEGDAGLADALGRELYGIILAARVGRELGVHGGEERHCLISLLLFWLVGLGGWLGWLAWVVGLGGWFGWLVWVFGSGVWFGWFRVGSTFVYER